VRLRRGDSRKARGTKCGQYKLEEIESKQAEFEARRPKVRRSLGARRETYDLKERTRDSLPERSKLGKKNEMAVWMMVKRSLSSIPPSHVSKFLLKICGVKIGE